MDSFVVVAEWDGTAKSLYQKGHKAYIENQYM